MKRLLLPYFCMATMALCLPLAASSHANSSEPHGLAPAARLGLPCTEGEVEGSPDLGCAYPASPAQHCKTETPSSVHLAEQITTSSLGFGDTAPDNGEIKERPVVTEVNTQLWRKSCQAEQGAHIHLSERCFWNNVAWSFTHHARGFCAHSLDLLYYHLILLLCKVTSILVMVIISIQLLARCMKRYHNQRERKDQSKEWWLESACSIIRRVDDYLACVICLQAYRPGEALKLLSCSHAFHGKCIDLWHRTQLGCKTCPLCLRRVTAVALIPLGARNSEREQP